MADRLQNRGFVTVLQATDCHSCPGRTATLWLAAGLFVLISTSGCRGVPVVDLGAKPPAARGTIAGIVRGPEGTSAVAGRTVEVVNVATGVRYTATTVANGGFSIELPAGKYRLDLPLHDGETLVKRPGVINLDHGEIESHVEFVLAAVRLVRPHGPAYRMDNGLGSPVA